MTVPSRFLFLGFREEEGGGLQLPIDPDISVLSARHLELQCGLNLVRERIEQNRFAKEPKKSKKDKDGARSPSKKVQSEKDKKTNKKEEKPASAAKKSPRRDRSPESPRSPRDDKAHEKTLAVLQQEKTRRQKAETQLQQSKALISDLQNQLSELQEHEQKTIQLRHELTISRLPAREASYAKGGGIYRKGVSPRP